MMDKEQTAIERLRQAAELSEFYYQKPLMLTYSGGERLRGVPRVGQTCGNRL